MGGMTAAVVASEMGTAIRSVILADPTFLPPERQREVYESDVAEQHRRLLGQDKDEVLAEARRRHPHRSSELLDLIVDARLRTEISAFEVLTPPNPDYRELVKAIAVPACLSSETMALSPSRRRGSCRGSINTSSHEVIANAGHGLPYDKPDEFAAVVRSFLATEIA